MTTNVLTRDQNRILPATTQNFSWLEKYVLMRAHPRGIFIDMVGLIWFIYYFWNQNWQMAVGAVVICRTLALLSVMDASWENLSKTTLGKIALLHLHPVNLATQLVGTIGLLYGIWQHSVELTLGGLSVILLGHLFGWAKVDSRFSCNSGFSNTSL